MRVATIGDNCLDVYMEQDRLTVGGNALNVAANWARSGLAARYFGVVGHDEAASAIRTVVAQAGLDADDVRILPGATGVTLIRLVGNDREFLHEEFGVGFDWVPGDDVLDQLVSYDWVHTAGVHDDADLTARLVARGHRVSVDLSTYHDFDRLDGVEIAFASWDGRLDSGAHDLAARMTAAGAQVAIVMCGAHGSLARSGTNTTTTKAHPITPVDTCGAGDSFIAAYVESHLRGNKVQISLVQATASATKTCTHLGGFEQDPQPVPDWVKTDYYPFVSGTTAPAQDVQL
jgi:fructoselysine 6-kinase